MPFKADDLKTVESYKKALKQDASKITAGGNTKFWVYRDVELPAAGGGKQKLPVLLALVDDTAVKPVVKGKQPACRGVCGVLEGKISFEPSQGTLPYNLLKTSVPLLLGKLLHVPSGADLDSEVQEVKAPTAPPPATGGKTGAGPGHTAPATALPPTPPAPGGKTGANTGAASTTGVPPTAPPATGGKTAAGAATTGSPPTAAPAPGGKTGASAGKAGAAEVPPTAPPAPGGKTGAGAGKAAAASAAPTAPPAPGGKTGTGPATTDSPPTAPPAPGGKTGAGAGKAATTEAPATPPSEDSPSDEEPGATEPPNPQSGDGPSDGEPTTPKPPPPPPRPPGGEVRSSYPELAAAYNNLSREATQKMAANPLQKAPLTKTLEAIRVLLNAGKLAEARQSMEQFEETVKKLASPAPPKAQGGAANLARSSQLESTWKELSQQARLRMSAHPAQRAAFSRLTAGIPEMIKAGKLVEAQKRLDKLEEALKEDDPPTTGHAPKK